MSAELLTFITDAGALGILLYVLWVVKQGFADFLAYQNQVHERQSSLIDKMIDGLRSRGATRDE